MPTTTGKINHFTGWPRWINIPTAVLFLTFLIFLFYAVAALFFPVVYVKATYEDLYGEWSQTYFLLASLIASILAVRKKGMKAGWFFVVVALASFYSFGEEISWGQRIFDIETPEYFAQHNIQGEMNIHNLFTGPVDTWTETLLTWAVSLALFGYGVAFPLLARLDFPPARWMIAKGVCPPPLFISPAFGLAAILELEPFAFNEQEVAELLATFGMAITSCHYALLWRKGVDPLLSPSQWPEKIATRYSKMVLLVPSLVVLAAVITVRLEYLSPNQREPIETRLANGYEKFAHRYQRYHYWKGVEAMLVALDKARPENTVVLRWLAKVRSRQHDQRGFEKYAKQALAVGLKRFKNNPDQISTSVSLSKTYRLLGKKELATGYARRAYLLAVAKVQKNPDDPHWDYWLAKSCEQVENYECALYFYKKAYQIAPYNHRYRKAYFAFRSLIDAYAKTN
ncbi:hypothetical protein [Alcanivorax sp.]|uniref:hypothetical protein n=1 Tax=Alcanivorax sp. TaxID=1872427 RepID=UPI0025847572|nr:hypothetical protein [Alcanivorax sp.]